MKKHMNCFLILCSLTFCDHLFAQSSSLTARYGFTPVAKQQSSKYYSLLYRKHFFNFLHSHTEIGGYTDPNDQDSFAAFRGYGLSFGKKLRFHGTFGVGIITNRGERLGGHLQFTEEINLDYNGLTIGYKHISNAGIKKPNLGRDFINVGYTLVF